MRWNLTFNTQTEIVVFFNIFVLVYFALCYGDMMIFCCYCCYFCSSSNLQHT